MLAKSKLTSAIKVLISKAFIDSSISHDEIVLINNELNEFYAMKEEIQNLKTKKLIKEFSLFIKQCYHIVWSVEKIQKVKIQSCKD